MKVPMTWNNKSTRKIGLSPMRYMWSIMLILHNKTEYFIFFFLLSSNFRFCLAAAAAAAAKSLQLYPTLCDPRDGSPPGSAVPRILQARNTGVGCHFLLQCMKVKSESEVSQSCPTLSDPMDCSLPGSSTHGIFQARVLEWVAIAFSVRWFI